MTVPNDCRRLHLHLVAVQILFIQQQITLFDNIQLDGLHGATRDLDTQRIALAGTQQTTSLPDSHTVVDILPIGIGRLIHVHYSLSYHDISLSLLCRFPIEAMEQLRMLAIVLGYLADGSLYQFTGIGVHDQHLLQLDGCRTQTDAQFPVLHLIQSHTLGTKPNIRHHYCLQLRFRLQHKVSITICHHGMAATRHAGTHQHLTSSMVKHLTTHLLSRLCTNGQHDQHRQ